MSVEESVQGNVSKQDSSTLSSAVEPSLSEIRSLDGEDVFNFALKHASIGAVLVDRRTGFKLTNPALCQMLGYTEAELQGKTFADILHPEDYEKSEVLSYLLSRREVYRFKKRFVRKSGELLWVGLAIKLIRDLAGLPLYGIGLIEPLEEERGTFQELPPTPSSPTVLVVDDEETTRSLVCDILKEQGYQVFSASSPLQALELARQYDGPIHLCVTDLIMPEMLGPELVRQLLRIRSQIKILYISGHSRREIFRRTGLERADSFLQKPFTPHELQRKVQEALNPPGSIDEDHR